MKDIKESHIVGYLGGQPVYARKKRSKEKPEKIPYGTFDGEKVEIPRPKQSKTTLRDLIKKFVKEQIEDAMVRFRKKIDAKRLVPSRSGSKGGDGGSSDGSDGGGT